MQALVIGGAGFIGANLARALHAAGHGVRVLDNLRTGSRENLRALPEVEFREGSLLDPAALGAAVRGCEVVFHLGAEVGNLNSLEHPFEDARTNGEGTLTVALAAHAAGVRRLVYSSSSAIFGEPVRLPIAEDHPCAPESYYGVSKLTGERYAWAAGRLTGLEVVCLRYFNVYGHGQGYNPYANVIPIFVEQLLRREPPIIYGDGEQTRDFVNVNDVVQANVLAAQAPVQGQIFNIGSGIATTVKALAQLIGDELASARDIRPQHAPARAGEVRHSVANIAHARACLGYEPRVTLTEGVRAYVQWYRESVQRGKAP